MTPKENRAPRAFNRHCLIINILTCLTIFYFVIALSFMATTVTCLIVNQIQPLDLSTYDFTEFTVRMGVVYGLLLISFTDNQGICFFKI